MTISSHPRLTPQGIRLYRNAVFIVGAVIGIAANSRLGSPVHAALASFLTVDTLSLAYGIWTAGLINRMSSAQKQEFQAVQHYYATYPITEMLLISLCGATAIAAFSLTIGNPSMLFFAGVAASLPIYFFVMKSAFKPQESL